MKKGRRVLALFISIFLRNRSLSDGRWFYGKKRKIGKGNLYLTENRLSWNEMCCASDNCNYMCHTCAKEFLNSGFNSAVIDKISNFHDIAPNFTFSQKIVIFQVYLQHLLHPYKVHGRDISGILFFIFASCEPLSNVLTNRMLAKKKKKKKKRAHNCQNVDSSHVPAIRFMGSLTSSWSIAFQLHY